MKCNHVLACRIFFSSF